jgi:hypothetical protein
MWRTHFLRAASTLLSTPGEPERRSVEKSLDAERRSACATVWSVKLFLRRSLVGERTVLGDLDHH